MFRPLYTEIGRLCLDVRLLDNVKMPLKITIIILQYLTAAHQLMVLSNAAFISEGLAGSPCTVTVS